jgi:hypothetical protein
MDPAFAGHVITDAWRYVKRSRLRPSFDEFRTICLKKIAGNRKIHPRWRNGRGGSSGRRALSLSTQVAKSDEKGRAAADPPDSPAARPPAHMAASDFHERLRKAYLAIQPALSEYERAVGDDFVKRVEAGGDLEDLSGRDIARAPTVAQFGKAETNAHPALAKVKQLLLKRLYRDRVAEAANLTRCFFEQGGGKDLGFLLAVLEEYLERSEQRASLECQQIAAAPHVASHRRPIEDVKRAVARIAIRMMAILGDA